MAAVPESSLEAGLTALHRGNFPEAIALLESVQNSSQPKTDTKIQAQKGLVAAYLGKGETSQAIAVLAILSQSNDPQVRAWATNNYSQLINLSPIDTTGFIAFEAEIPQVNKKNLPANSIEIEVTPPPVPPAPDKAEKVVTPFRWRQAPRAQRWQPLEEVNFVPLWLLMAGSAIALFWLIREGLKFVMLWINSGLVKLPYLEPFQPFYRDPSNLVYFLLLFLIILCPWLLDRLLQLSYNSQPLSINQLAKHSPESGRVLQRYCRQQDWPLPQLTVLPTSAPIAFSYGNLRRTARIAVSQGLLTQLADDEIASIYAGELGHIASWDFVLMSLFMVLTQSVYGIYRCVATWGDRVNNSTIKIAAVTISSIAYGLWRLLSFPALGLSQWRIYYSDCFASSITGNPNGLTRALIKIAMGITTDVQQKESTSWLVESLNIFLPVGFCQAITIGSFFEQIESILVWDCLNPYRYLLTLNHTHPLMGDRLQRLNALAQNLHLTTELNLPNKSKKAIAWQSLLVQLKPLLTHQALLQFAAFFGVVFGLVFGGLTWLVGAISLVIWIPQLAWMYGDWLLIKALIPISVSIGLFLRINFLFPDITPKSVGATPTDLAEQLATNIPIDSNPVRLRGKLLGRQGIGNWLGQDLLLNSPQGLFKLHFESPLGFIGNIFFRQMLNPTDLLGRHILVTGWFRRSATVWIDLHALQTQTGKVSYSYQPFWATIMALAIALYGTSLLVLGQ